MRGFITFYNANDIDAAGLREKFFSQAHVYERWIFQHRVYTGYEDSDDDNEPDPFETFAIGTWEVYNHSFTKRFGPQYQLDYNDNIQVDMTSDSD
jgi:hypothetical protein